MLNCAQSEIHVYKGLYKYAITFRYTLNEKWRAAVTSDFSAEMQSNIASG